MLCECGCGGLAPISPVSHKRLGYVKGQPRRFIRFHHHRVRDLADSGSTHIDANGYVRVLVHLGDAFFNMAHRNGPRGSWYILEHRLVMAQHLGRSLTDEEVVHHKNEIVDDNRLENLQLFSSNVEHRRVAHAKN